MLSKIVYEYLLPTTLRSVCAATNSSSAHSLRGKSRYFFKSCLYSTIIHHHKWISCRTVQWGGGITLKKYLLSISGSSSVWRQSPEAKGGLISERFSLWFKSQKRRWQITILSTIHLKRRCSWYGFGTIFWEIWAKVKNVLRLDHLYLAH